MGGPTNIELASVSTCVVVLAFTGYILTNIANWVISARRLYSSSRRSVVSISFLSPSSSESKGPPRSSSSASFASRTSSLTSRKPPHCSLIWAISTGRVSGRSDFSRFGRKGRVKESAILAVVAVHLPLECDRYCAFVWAWESCEVAKSQRELPSKGRRHHVHSDRVNWRVRSIKTSTAAGIATTATFGEYLWKNYLYSFIYSI